MIPAGVVPDPILSAFHRQFPARQHLWAGHLRLWHVEAAHASSTLLSEWIARAANPLSLGLPIAVVQSIRASGVARQSFAFLDLPSGLFAIPVPAQTFDSWPEPTPVVPPQVLHPVGADAMRIEGDWRTVPVVRVEMVLAVAVQVGDAIDVYSTDSVRLGSLPVNSFPTASPDDWATAWQNWAALRGQSRLAIGPTRLEGGALRVPGLDSATGEVWLWAGEGPMREAAIVLPAT